ncbi:PREDICTED: induced myeloid leukemia cell differentiation protein Mcl-1 [Pygoscelis adeliae]|uniref:induced myeloid leukemia cell differentiation protein Mcl-1 n=1 Tax=Pygoscelis adeliae TaxID=9238 RepID=UPI0004F4F17D|nr:PREDICTED: induced myeloid leukemia cell differentiation protein Mcl-1 [Pygoscelis adeliae]
MPGLLAEGGEAIVTTQDENQQEQFQSNSPADGVAGLGRCSNEPTAPPWGCLNEASALRLPPPTGHFAAPQAHPTAEAGAGCLRRDALFQPGANLAPRLGDLGLMSPSQAGAGAPLPRGIWVAFGQSGGTERPPRPIRRIAAWPPVCHQGLRGNPFLPSEGLEIQKEEDLQSVCEVAAHVFSDGVTNWGRVVTLISFGAFVAKHLKSINQEKCISSLAGIITDALVSSKREWLMSQGGWEGFVDFFRVEDLEGSIRNVLMAFAGVAGLGASLAYMIR